MSTLPWVRVKGQTYVELDALLLMLDEYERDLSAAGACVGSVGAVGDLADALAHHGRTAADRVAWLGVLAGYVADDAPEPERDHPPGSPVLPAEPPARPDHPSGHPSP